MAQVGTAETVRRRSVVPRVEGYALDTARIMLQNAGFESILVHFVEAYAAEDDVVVQFPAYGQLVDVATEIKLQVARKSWLDYMPGVYRQAVAAGDTFLRDFLYIFQTIHAGIERRLERLHEVFDPATTDAEFLPWLASWVGLLMDPEWDEHTRRKWIREAPRLYATRGTKRCLVTLIRIFTGLEAKIDENRWPYDGVRAGVSGRIGVDAIVMPTVNRAHAFIVNVPVRYEDLSERQVLRLHQVILTEKPAHTIYVVRFRKGPAEGVMQSFLQVGATPIGVSSDGEREPPKTAVKGEGDKKP
jgi:phage tail-like protein